MHVFCVVVTGSMSPLIVFQFPGESGGVKRGEGKRGEEKCSLSIYYMLSLLYALTLKNVTTSGSRCYY